MATPMLSVGSWRALLPLAMRGQRPMTPESLELLRRPLCDKLAQRGKRVCQLFKSPEAVGPKEDPGPADSSGVLPLGEPGLTVGKIEAKPDTAPGRYKLLCRQVYTQLAGALGRACVVLTVARGLEAISWNSPEQAHWEVVWAAMLLFMLARCFQLVDSLGCWGLGDVPLVGGISFQAAPVVAVASCIALLQYWLRQELTPIWRAAVKDFSSNLQRWLHHQGVAQMTEAEEQNLCKMLLCEALRRDDQQQKLCRAAAAWPALQRCGQGRTKQPFYTSLEQAEQQQRALMESFNKAGRRAEKKLSHVLETQGLPSTLQAINTALQQADVFKRLREQHVGVCGILLGWLNRALLAVPQQLKELAEQGLGRTYIRHRLGAPAAGPPSYVKQLEEAVLLQHLMSLQKPREQCGEQQWQQWLLDKAGRNHLGRLLGYNSQRVHRRESLEQAREACQDGLVEALAKVVEQRAAGELVTLGDLLGHLVSLLELRTARGLLNNGADDLLRVLCAPLSRLADPVKLLWHPAPSLKYQVDYHQQCPELMADCLHEEANLVDAEQPDTTNPIMLEPQVLRPDRDTREAFKLNSKKQGPGEGKKEKALAAALEAEELALNLYEGLHLATPFQVTPYLPDYKHQRKQGKSAKLQEEPAVLEREDPALAALRQVSQRLAERKSSAATADRPEVAQESASPSGRGRSRSRSPVERDSRSGSRAKDEDQLPQPVLTTPANYNTRRRSSRSQSPDRRDRGVRSWHRSPSPDRYARARRSSRERYRSPGRGGGAGSGSKRGRSPATERPWQGIADNSKRQRQRYSRSPYGRDYRGGGGGQQRHSPPPQHWRGWRGSYGRERNRGSPPRRYQAGRRGGQPRHPTRAVVAAAAPQQQERVVGAAEPRPVTPPPPAAAGGRKGRHSSPPSSPRKRERSLTPPRWRGRSTTPPRRTGGISNWRAVNQRAAAAAAVAEQQPEPCAPCAAEPAEEQLEVAAEQEVEERVPTDNPDYDGDGGYQLDFEGSE